MAAPSASELVVVITGGDVVDPAHLEAVTDDAFVIAADSGIDHAQALGLRIDLAIGDFDSVTPAALATATATGTRIERHPAAKDATDLELALDAAISRRPGRIHVLGGHGGRLDHLLANALVLAAPAWASAAITAQMGPARLSVVRSTVELPGPVGDLVSLVPAPRARARGDDERPAVPPRSRGPAPRVDPGHQQRAHPPTGPRQPRARRARGHPARFPRNPPRGAPPMTTFPRRALLMISALALLPLAGCGDDTDSGATTTGSGTVRLLTHDSFLLSDGSSTSSPRGRASRSSSSRGATPARS